MGPGRCQALTLLRKCSWRSSAPYPEVPLFLFTSLWSPSPCLQWLCCVSQTFISATCLVSLLDWLPRSHFRPCSAKTCPSPVQRWRGCAGASGIACSSLFRPPLGQVLPVVAVGPSTFNPCQACLWRTEGDCRL